MSGEEKEKPERKDSNVHINLPITVIMLLGWILILVPRKCRVGREKSCAGGKEKKYSGVRESDVM